MTISDEAVEAAAKAIADLGGRGLPWIDLADAQAAIEAALPILRAQFAEEVAATIEVVFAKTEYGDGQVRIALNRLTERIRAAIMRNLGTK